jgi:hypothetical protein
VLLPSPRQQNQSQTANVCPPRLSKRVHPPFVIGIIKTSRSGIMTRPAVRAPILSCAELEKCIQCFTSITLELQQPSIFHKYTHRYQSAAMSFLLLSVLDIFPNKPWVWKRGARDALFRMPHAACRMPHAVLQPIYFMLFSDVEYKVSVATSPLSRHATTLSRTKSLRSRVLALLRISKSFFGHIMYRSLRFKLVCHGSYEKNTKDDQKSQTT